MTSTTSMDKHFALLRTVLVTLTDVLTGEPGDALTIIHDHVWLLETTNAAHITVVNDYMEEELVKFITWFQKDSQEQYSRLNNQTVKALLRTRRLEELLRANKIEVPKDG